MTIEAFANHLSSHFGRHLLYWLISTESSTRPQSTGLKVRISDLINKFHGPLERGVQVLDHLLTLEEEDFQGHWGTPYAHNYEPQIQHTDYEPENREVLPLAVLYDQREQQRPSDMRFSIRMETLNNGNALHHSPPHNNPGHLTTTEQRNLAMTPVGSVGGTSTASAVVGSSSSSSSSGEHNMQITQPISAPSSPLGSPGALGSGTAAFCLPSSSSTLLASSLVSSSSGSSNTHAASDTADTNWQAAKAHVLERNAATTASTAATATNMFNNELMSATSSLSVATLNNSGAGGSNNGSGSFVCAHNGGGLSTALDTADPNWQASKATVLERNAAMFNNELMSDVKFIVGEDFDTVQSIPAHKYILATGSSVFYAMFYGGLAEKKQEIKVPDVEPSAFLTLLRYLYCDEIQLEPDNILATLYAAKKYIVPHLARACVNYLEVKLTAKNACLLLSQSRLFEEPELMQRCWEVIDAQAEMAIKSEDFVDIDLKTFESILSRETLNCKEIHLFEAALNWALNACQKMGIDLTAQNKRIVLGSALHLIRIPTMTLEEFANGVAQSGILTAQETIDIFLHFTAQTKPTLNYATRQRAGLKTQVCHRFQSCAYRSNQWRYRGRCDSIQFSVDRRIFIVGFGLYGSSTGAANYNVKIELKRLGRTLAENDTKFFSDGSSNTFHVFFENPIQIEPECYYTASVILDGNELSFFGQEGMTEVCMGNVTFQFQCSSESTNGTGVQGGQIPELIYYGPTAVVTGLNSPTNSLCGTPLTGSSGHAAIQNSLGLPAILNAVPTNGDDGIATSSCNNDGDATNS